jgi:hypothetical protein
MGDADNWNGYICVQTPDVWEIFVLPVQCCCEPPNALIFLKVHLFIM